MKLLEVVKGANSAPDVLATAMALGRKIGKISALAGNCDGFVANRSRAPFNSEMIILLEEGALPEQVDKVMVDFGYPIGPFAVADLSGLDIGYDTRKRRAEQNPNYRKMPIADRIVEAGRLTASSMNGQPWHFVVVQEREHLDQLGALVRTGPYISGAALTSGLFYGIEPVVVVDLDLLLPLMSASFLRTLV